MINNTGQVHLEAKLASANEYLTMLSECDKETVIAELQKDVERYTRMIGEQYEIDANLDHYTSGQFDD